MIINLLPPTQVEVADAEVSSVGECQCFAKRWEE
jgi:hypothetical protein